MRSAHAITDPAQPTLFKAYEYRGAKRRLLGRFVADGSLYPPIVNDASRAIGAEDARQPGTLKRVFRHNSQPPEGRKKKGNQ